MKKTIKTILLIISIVCLFTITGKANAEEITNDYIYMPLYNVGKIQVIDKTTNTVIDTITVGEAPSSCVYSVDGKYLYVSNCMDFTISKIELSTNTVVNTIVCGDTQLYAIIISSDGMRAYVGSEGCIRVIDLENDDLIDTLIMPNSEAHYTDLRIIENKLYICTQFSSDLCIYDLTNGQCSVKTAPNDYLLYSMAVSPNGKKLALGTNSTRSYVMVYDIETESFTRYSTEVFGYGVEVEFSANGKYLYVGNTGKAISKIYLEEDKEASALVLREQNNYTLGIDIKTNLAYILSTNEALIIIINLDTFTISRYINIDGVARVFGGFMPSVYDQVANSNSVTVTFNYNNGDNVTTSDYEKDDLVIKPTNPIKIGYSFKGWYSDESCTTAWDFENDVVTENMNLYAKWVQIYTVSINGTDTDVEKGAKIVKPTDPTKTGYVFKGWYKEEACTTAWNFENDVVNSNTTLYIKWVKLHTITLISDTGISTTITAEDNSIINPPVAPTKTGYTFDGWYKEEARTTAWNFSTEKITSDTTLYAKWIISNNNNSTTNGSSNNGLGIGGVIGVVVGLLILVFIVLYFLWEFKNICLIGFLVPLFRKINELILKTSLNRPETRELETENNKE